MKRERNFEVMRTIAMYFIVVYHCLTHGVGGNYGFTINNPIAFTNIVFSDFMLAISSVAVNLYVMTSGYFLAAIDFKMSRIIRTWVQTCFYSFSITILFMSFQITPFSVVALGKSFFPISTDAYWFVTQYIGLLILSPFLTLLIKELSYSQFVGLLIGGAFLCLAIIPDFPLAKRFHVAHGNSVWSFAYLYLLSGFIRLYIKKVPKIKLLIAMIFFTLLMMVVEMFLGTHNDFVRLYWLNYNGLPFILSVVAFVFVRDSKVPDNRFWNTLVSLAPYTFGVYLVHDHLLVREWLWGTIPLSSQCEQLMYPVVVLGSCLLVFVIGAFVDWIRKRLFAFLNLDYYFVYFNKYSFHK